MPPRLQCLNASRGIGHKPPDLRYSFSTANRALIDSTRSSAADLLASLGDDSDSSFKTPMTFKFPYTPTPKIPQRATISQRPQPGNSAATSGVSRLIEQSKERARRMGSRQPGELSGGTIEELQKHRLSSELSRQITRRWRAGDVYAPHDLSGPEMCKWKTRDTPAYDVFDVLDFNPLTEYKNFSVLSEYMTPMGRIKHSNETGLRPVNQRRIAKAIRRSIGMGMMPSVHRHPEILQKEVMRHTQSSPLRGVSM